MNFWLNLILLSSLGDVFYHFGISFGQIFRDRLYNSSQVALSGSSSEPDANDVLSTDRGAYFPDKFSMISLNPNEISPDETRIKGNFTAVFWFMAIKGAQGMIFHRKMNTEDTLSVMHSFNTFYFSLKTAKDSIIIKHSIEAPSYGDQYLGFWVMIGIRFEGSTLKVSFDDSVEFTSQLRDTFVETSVEHFSLGSSGAGTFGFIWFYLHKFEIVPFSRFISNTKSNSCLLEICPPCIQNISVIDEVLGKTGCLSNSVDASVASIPCSESCTSGCSEGVCLDCFCKPQSCLIKSKIVECDCLATTRQVNQTCTCDVPFYFNGFKCTECRKDCSSCVESSSCTSCKDMNSILVSGDCLCKEGYFSEVPLSEEGTCITCNPSCTTCNNNGCMTCIENSFLNNRSECVCDDGFYLSKNSKNETICLKCQSHCKSCSNNTACIECLVENALPSAEGCKCPEMFFVTGEMNSSTTICEPCLDECQTCTNQSSCLKCFADFSVIDQQSLCACQKGYFQIDFMFKSGACRECELECEECDEMNMCLSCKAKNSYVNEKGRCSCNENFYMSSELSQQDACRPCHSDCESCQDTSICLICKDRSKVPSEIEGCKCEIGTFLNSTGSCEKCRDICLTCSDKTSCSSCKSPHALPDTCECPLTTYFDGKNCKSCFIGCEKCSDSATCEKCLIENTFSENFCVCKLEVIENNCTCKELHFVHDDACFPCTRWITRRDFQVELINRFTQIRIIFNETLQLNEFFNVISFIKKKEDILGDEPYEVKINNKNEFIITLGKNNRILNQDLEINMTEMKAENIECGYFHDNIYKHPAPSDSERPLPLATILSYDSIELHCGSPASFNISGLQSTGGFGSPLNCFFNLTKNTTDPLSIDFKVYPELNSCVIEVFLERVFSSVEYSVELTVENYYGKTNSTIKKIMVTRLKDATVSFSNKEKGLFECAPSKACELTIEIITLCQKAQDFTYEWKEIEKESKNLSHPIIVQNTSTLMIQPYTYRPGNYFYNLSINSSGANVYNEIIRVIITQVQPIIKLDKSSGTISSKQDFTLDASASFDPNNFGTTENLLFFWKYCFLANECIERENQSVLVIPQATLELKKEISIYLKVKSMYSDLIVSEEFSAGILGIEIPDLKIVVSNSTNVPRRIPFQSSTSFEILTNLEKINNDSIFWKIDNFSLANSLSTQLNPQLLNLESKSYKLLLNLYTKNGQEINFFNQFSINNPPTIGKFTFSPKKNIRELTTEVHFQVEDCKDEEEDFPLFYLFGYQSDSFLSYLKFGQSTELKTVLTWDGDNSKVFIKVYDSFWDYSEEFIPINITKATPSEIEAYFRRNQIIEPSSKIPQVLSNILLSTIVRNANSLEIDENMLKFLQEIFISSVHHIERFMEECVVTDPFITQIATLLNQLTMNQALKTGSSNDFEVDTSQNFNKSLNVMQKLMNKLNDQGLEAMQAEILLDVLNNIVDIDDSLMFEQKEKLLLVYKTSEKISILILKRHNNYDPINIISKNINSTIFFKYESVFSHFEFNSSEFSVEITENAINSIGNEGLKYGILTNYYFPNPSSDSIQKIVSLTVYDLKSDQNFDVKMKEHGIKITIPVNKTEASKNCLFLNESSTKWVQNGCVVDKVLDDSVICACNHLSLFGVFTVETKQEKFLDLYGNNHFSSTTPGFWLVFSLLLVYFLLKFYFSLQDNKPNQGFRISKKSQEDFSDVGEKDDDILNRKQEDLSTNKKIEDSNLEKIEIFNNNKESCCKKFSKAYLKSILFYDLLFSKSSTEEKGYEITKNFSIFFIEMFLNINSYYNKYKKNKEFQDMDELIEDNLKKYNIVTALITVAIVSLIRIFVFAIEKAAIKYKTNSDEEKYNRKKIVNTIIMVFCLLSSNFCIFMIISICSAFDKTINILWIICSCISLCVDIFIIQPLGPLIKYVLKKYFRCELKDNNQ